MSSFLIVLWENGYFVFVTLDHWLILLNSLFELANSTGMSQFGKNRLVYLQTLHRESLRCLASR